MFYIGLIQLIEANSDEIIDRMIRHIRRDPELIHLSTLPDAELRDLGQRLVKRLGHWLTATKEEETAVARHYETIGHAWFEDAIPLHEAVHAVLLVKEKMIDFVQDQALAQTSVQVFAEEELERRVDRFFDTLICHFIRGYEDAMHRVSPVGA